MVTDDYDQIESRYYDIDDITIHYKMVGHGRHYVLFTPGTLGDCDHFRYQLCNETGFDRARYTLVVWDVPGYGLTRPRYRKQDANMNMRDAYLAVKLMQHLKLTPFTSIGWSEGARTATIMAYLYPNIIRRIVLFACAFYVTKEKRDTFEKARDYTTWDNETIKALDKKYERHYWVTQWESGIDVVLNAHDLHGGPLPVYFNMDKVRKPVLLLSGSNDKLKDMTHLEKGFKNSPLVKSVVKPGGEHDIQFSNYKWFNRHVKMFLDDEKIDDQ